MSGVFSARCTAHRVPCIALSGLRIASCVPCAAPSASRIVPFAPRQVHLAARNAFPASCSPRPSPPSKTTETGSKPLTHLR